MPNDVEQFRNFVNGVMERDGLDLERVKRAATAAATGFEAAPGASEGAEGAVLEAIISLHRPVFEIDNDVVKAELAANLTDAESSLMTKLVKDNAARINATIPAIGRIDLPGDENYPWAGTGWVVDSELGSDIVVTNAHVAELFAQAIGGGFDFKNLPFLERLEAPIIDFRREISETPPRRFKVLDVIYIGTPGFLDVAFLRVAKSSAADRPTDQALARPLKLASGDPAADTPVVTIGYPGTDRGHYDLETLLRVYGNVFDTKRCAPGKVTGMDNKGISHDCSSMPGSSGSALIDVTTGEVVGLHFQGIPFRSNHAVPISAVRKLIKEQPWRNSGINIRTETESTTDLAGVSAAEPNQGTAGGIVMKVSSLGDGSGIKFVVPLEITVRIGASADATLHPADTTPMSLETAEAQVRQQVLTHSNVVGVRSTFLFDENGKITNRKGVVIKVRPEASRNAADYGLQPQIGGVPVSIEMADLASLAEKLAPGLEAPATMQAYKRDLSDPRFSLDPVTEQMKLNLHVSPEAGWRVLSKFFDGNDYNRVTIGMYNFTAQHIVESVRNAIKPDDHRMVLTLDRKTDDIGTGNKADDWPEEKVVKALERDGGDRFHWTPASVSGPGRLFATSYHIKVAVLGDAAKSKRFWLSSGNWASSNQAPFDDADHPLDSLTWSDVKTYDRDWHAVVESETLAATFRNHLEQDFKDCEEVAGQEAAAPELPDMIVPEDYFLEAPRTVRTYKAFPPKILEKQLTVQPVLTPDNYPDVVLPLIKNARESILFINQSFDIKDDEDQIPPHYRALLDALLERQQTINDVRIIFRSGYGKERDIFRRAVEFGFDKTRIRFYGTCHTKGIVVDGNKVLLGSQNWTGAGTKPNRDASLLISDVEAARYFTDIFEFDWANIATDRVPAEHGSSRAVRTRASDQEAAVPAGFRVVPWGAWNGT
jgi:V8-like Glu-specific endopeptidase